MLALYEHQEARYFFLECGTAHGQSCSLVILLQHSFLRTHSTWQVLDVCLATKLLAFNSYKAMETEWRGKQNEEISVLGGRNHKVLFQTKSIKAEGRDPLMVILLYFCFCRGHRTKSGQNCLNHLEITNGFGFTHKFCVRDTQEYRQHPSGRKKICSMQVGCSVQKGICVKKTPSSVWLPHSVMFHLLSLYYRAVTQLLSCSVHKRHDLRLLLRDMSFVDWFDAAHIDDETVCDGAALMHIKPGSSRKYPVSIISVLHRLLFEDEFRMPSLLHVTPQNKWTVPLGLIWLQES